MSRPLEWLLRGDSARDAVRIRGARQLTVRNCSAPVAGVSSATVKAHMSRAIKDMGLFRRHQLVRYVFENGLFDPETAQAEILRRRAAC